MDARMPIPLLVSSMPMPSYASDNTVPTTLLNITVGHYFCYIV